MPTNHDSGYRHLFADPVMTRDLLTGFVPHERVMDADFATLSINETRWALLPNTPAATV